MLNVATKRLLKNDNTINSNFISIIKKQKSFSCPASSNNSEFQRENSKLSASVLKEILRFNTETPLEESVTPPSSWYLKKDFFELECEKIFKRNWIGVSGDHKLKQSGSFITGEVVNQPYVIVNAAANEAEQTEKAQILKAYYNVCMHHAAQVASGSGTCSEFVCPYHGWTYNLNGSLTKSTSMKGIKNFRPKNYGLKPINLERLGNILFLNFDQNNNSNSLGIDSGSSAAASSDPTENDHKTSSNNTKTNTNSTAAKSFQDIINPFTNQLQEFDFDPTFSDLKFVKRKEYKINCNWKVFIDNFCDGGYHVPFAHKNLSRSLNLSTYKINVYDKVSIQTTLSNDDSKSDSRVGHGAVYAYVYPNIMFNRYGPWLDINVVTPLSETESMISIEWYVRKELSTDADFINECLKSSKLVQEEDVFLCETVMKGLKSDAYDFGRYVPSKELPAHHFHKLLVQDLLKE